MMRNEYLITVGGHKFEKLNLSTKLGRNGTYDEYRCSECGLKGKSYRLGYIRFPEKYKKNIHCCPGMTATKKMAIIKCNAFSPAFKNLTPGSIHDIIAPPIGQSNNYGEWVQGVGEPVLVLYGEFEYIK